MNAMVYTQYGPPEVVTMQQVAKPVPLDHEVLIKIHTTTVNRTDCGFRSAEYFIVRFFSGLLKPKNPILGNEFSGIVESVGNAVNQFKPGDKVFGYNDTKFGAHAEYMVMGQDDPICSMPEHFSFSEAAALSEGIHYAWCDIKAAKICAGHQVLINGATGAIGSAAVQLCAYLGAEVTAVCSTNYIELVKSLGAKRVIDYTKDDFTSIDTQFDVVFDAVGKSSFGKCKPLLKKQGVYMSTELGRYSQNPFLAMITPILGGKKVLFPLPTIHKRDLEFFKELAERGKLKPVIDRTYPLSNIVEAYQYVETGQKIGNVIIAVS
jgi:NADPH:quinone reductase-like Zn-dependent oxidoreductase